MEQIRINYAGGVSLFGTAAGGVIAAPAVKPKLYEFYASWANQCKSSFSDVLENNCDQCRAHNVCTA